MLTQMSDYYTKQTLKDLNMDRLLDSNNRRCKDSTPNYKQNIQK